MADEVVYRLVLDGQAASPGTTGSSGAFPSSRPYRPAGYPDEDFNPHEGARARIAREQKAELEDRAYRAMKRGVPMSTIEDEDHQARIDRMEADAEAKKQEERRQKLKEDPYAMARELLQRQAKAEELRLAMTAVSSNSTIEAVREKEANERMATEAAKRLDEQEKEQAAQDAARKREEEARLARDPVHLAQQSLQREQLAEQARLNKLAMQRGDGSTAESIQREEMIREQAKAGAAWTQRGGNALAKVMTGANPINAGLDVAAASGGPIIGTLAQTASALLSAVKANAQESRRISREISPFSGALTLANVEEDIKDLRFKIALAREQGGRRAEIERQSRELDRREMRTGLESQEFDNWMRRAWLGVKDKVRDAADWAKPDAMKDLEKDLNNRLEAKKKADEAKQRDFNNKIPPPFEWVKDVNEANAKRNGRNKQIPQPAIQGPGPFLKMPGV